jgi:integrase
MPGCRNLSEAETLQIIEAMRGPNRIRNRALWILGINTGFRISELLSLKLSDVIEFNRIRDEITVERRNMKKKTRSRSVPLNDCVKYALIQHIQDMNRRGYCHKDDPLFPNKKGQPLGRREAWRIIKTAKTVAALPGKIATHSMRKTFGTNAHEKLMDYVAAGERRDVLLETAEMLGHIDPRSTLAYLPDTTQKTRIVNDIGIGGNITL